MRSSSAAVCAAAATIWVLALGLAGCSQPKFDQPRTDEETLFNPVAMRIHPIFTQVKNWSGKSDPDGVEVLLEFQDRFSDPTKAAGTVTFELYTYRQGDPDPRGNRLASPFQGYLLTLEDQKARWNRTSRTYTFQLAYPAIRYETSYVLAATFRTLDGGRMFDRVVIEGHAPEHEAATTTATTPNQPTTRVPAP